MEVYDLSSPVARTEVRAMYGGLQMAIGTAALVGVAREQHRDSALGFFVLAVSGLSLCRLGGMVAEGETSHLSFSTKIAPGKYNHVGLAMYELPNMVLALAWILFLVRPRSRLGSQTHRGGTGSSDAGRPSTTTLWREQVVNPRSLDYEPDSPGNRRPRRRRSRRRRPCGLKQYRRVLTFSSWGDGSQIVLSVMFRGLAVFFDYSLVLVAVLSSSLFFAVILRRRYVHERSGVRA